jgi:hypothetical protein
MSGLIAMIMDPDPGIGQGEKEQGSINRESV